LGDWQNTYTDVQTIHGGIPWMVDQRTSIYLQYAASFHDGKRTLTASMHSHTDKKQSGVQPSPAIWNDNQTW
jgi:hypothetical protein